MAQEQGREAPKRWNNRPESTIAQNFALDLDSMFGLGAAEEVHNLSRTVEEKKMTVTSGEQTLQQLEARLRETEERLAKVSRHNSPSRQASVSLPTPHANDQNASDGTLRPSPLAQKPTYPADRPPTAQNTPVTKSLADQTAMLNMPGAMPAESPQPQHNGSNEYVMVDRNMGQAQRGLG